MAIKPYLQLVRLPNVFTAAADSLAGWLLVGGTFDDPRRWLPLLGASMAIYAAGIALNDVFDLEIDRVERPGRPLPSGRVSRRSAAWIGGTLLALGPMLAAGTGSTASLAVAAVLALAVLAYDLGLRRSWLGPEVMGACRGLNLLLGMSQAPALGGPAGWMAAGGLAVFVVGLTWISRSETLSGRASGAIAGTTLQDIALLVFAAAAMGVLGPYPGASLGRPIVPIEGLLVLTITGLVVNLADSRAIREPSPQTLQHAVKTGVFSLVWLDVALVASARGPTTALAVATWWFPAWLIGRWLYST